MVVVAKPIQALPLHSKMIINQIFGFTLKKQELLKLILKKLETEPNWAGEHYIYSADELQEQQQEQNQPYTNCTCCLKPTAEDISEWTLDGKVYNFVELACLIGDGSNENGQAKMRELIPELPAEAKFFVNPWRHKHIWYVGICMSTIDTGAEEMVQKQACIIDMDDLDNTLFALFDVTQKLITCGRVYSPQIYACPTDCYCCP